MNTPNVGPVRLDHQSRVETNQHIVKCSSKADDFEEWVTLEYAANRIAGYMDVDLDEAYEYLEGGGKAQTISFIYYIPKAHEALMAAYEEDKKNRPAQHTPI